MKTRPGFRYDEATHQWLPLDPQPEPAPAEAQTYPVEYDATAASEE